MGKPALRLIVMLFSIIVLGMLSLPAGASVSSKRVGVDVSLNPGDPGASNIRIQWVYSAGDVLEKSVDGVTWTVVPQTENGKASIEAVPNWSILYFRLNEGGGGVSNFTAYPPNLNAHDTYSLNSSMCAGCHVTHAAEGRKLLKGVNQKELCRICHG